MPTKEIESNAIDFAKHLVSHHKDADVSAYERLSEVANNLDVCSIKPRCVVGDGSVSRLKSGSYEVLFNPEHPLMRRRYTVAHELGHLVLERFYPHIGMQAPTERNTQSNSLSQIEKLVNRLASEILLPEEMFTQLIQNTETRHRRRNNCFPQKRSVTDTQRVLGVSQSATLFRLVEVHNLDTVLIRGFSDSRRYVCYPDENGKIHLMKNWQSEVSTHCDFSSLTQSRQVELVAVREGREVSVECEGWYRRFWRQNKQMEEAWIVGWLWN